MATNYDPDKIPTPTGAEYEYALMHGMEILNVVCLSDNKEDDMSFSICVKVVPRIGEWLRLEDGKTLEVTNVWHRVTTVDGVSRAFITVVALPRKRNQTA